VPKKYLELLLRVERYIKQFLLEQLSKRRFRECMYLRKTVGNDIVKHVDPTYL